MNQRIAAQVSLIMLLLLFSPAAHAGTFPDTDQHWADGDIVILYHSGMSDGTPTVIDGEEINLYYPDKNLTRAEFAKLISRSLHLTKYYTDSDVYESISAQITNNPFTDISKNDWFYQDVLITKAAGIMTGLPDYTFLPEQFITREETAQVIVNYCNFINNYRNEGNKLVFETGRERYTDDSAIAAWAKDAVYTFPAIQGSTGNNVMQGYPDGSFQPSGYLTRAEVSAIMVRLCEIRG